MTDDEKAEFVNKNIGSMSDEFLGVNVDRLKAVLRSGIAESNLKDKPLTETDLEEILEYEPLALELVGIIEGYNRPLAKATSKT